MFDFSDLFDLFHRNNKNDTQIDANNVDSGHHEEYFDGIGCSGEQSDKINGLMHSNNNGDDDASQDDYNNYLCEGVKNVQNGDYSVSENIDTVSEPDECIQSHDRKEISFKGFSSCSKCSCREFTGSGECCDNCGHNYHDHYY